MICRYLAIVLGAAGFGASVSYAVQPKVASARVDVLAKSTASWNGKAYTAYPSGQPQLTVLKFTIPANTALPWHTHPFPNAGYVLSGQITVEDKVSGKKQTFTAGQAFTESVDDVHRGRSGPAPVTLIVTYSGIPDVPTFKPDPGQKPEYLCDPPAASILSGISPEHGMIV